MASLIYLDTNVTLWLAGAPDQLSPTAIEALNEAESLRISPMVELELEYLYETGRTQRPATFVLEHLTTALELRRCERPFGLVVRAALDLKWTRDPFDRLITAQAGIENDALLTRDKIIRANYQPAFW